MKKGLLTLLLSICFVAPGMTQTFCDPNGNLVIFSNYDGGILNINVDVNIPNLKIGVVTYEAIQINLSGTYVGNVTDVFYAGYNGTNDNCNTGVTNTSINGFSGNDSIAIYPPVTLSNTYGNPNIVCAYSCVTNQNQGGCNTVDQVEAYFAAVFPGSTLRFHKVQYNCWGTTQTISGGGNCCGSITNLTAQATFTPITCNGGCNGVATASAVGGTGPYTYQWTGGPATAGWSGLCAGTYTVTVTDQNSATDTQSVTIPDPPVLGSNINQTACMSYNFNSQTLTSSGIYYDTLTSQAGCDSFITLNLTIGTGVNLNTNLSGGTLTSAQGNGTYQWINCANNSPIAGATAQSYTPTSSGNYAVIVSYMGCSDTSACTNVIPASVNSLPEATEFNVYPNPAHTEVYIESAVTKGVYKVTDHLGRVVLQGNINGNKTVVPLRDIAPGVYLLSIDDSRPIKLLKQ
jgi:hypothetical protein